MPGHLRRPGVLLNFQDGQHGHRLALNEYRVPGIMADSLQELSDITVAEMRQATI